MRCVLVTGASGYIGRHLVQALKAVGYEVRGFSRRPMPPEMDGIEWVEGSVTNWERVQSGVAGCQAIVHLACLSLPASLSDPLAAFRVNALGTLHVLQAAHQEGNCPVVFTSTAQVYGSPQRLPIDEEHPVRPAGPYAAGKLCGEVMAFSMARSVGLPVTVLRLFNVYGPALDGRQRPTVEAIFVRRVARGLPPVICGHPHDGRDFIHVRDVVRAISLALERPPVGDKPLNIGAGVMTTVRELAGLVIRLSGCNLEPIVQVEDRLAFQLQADVTRAAHCLGFRSQIKLEDGLAEMLRLEMEMEMETVQRGEAST